MTICYNHIYILYKLYFANINAYYLYASLLIGVHGVRGAKFYKVENGFMSAIDTVPDTASPGWNKTGETSGIDAPSLKAWMDAGDTLLVDVREPHEFEHERIPSAFLVSMSRFEVESFPQVPGLKTVLVSEAGPRSVALAERLHDAGFKDIYALEGGLSAWKEAGFATGS